MDNKIIALIVVFIIIIAGAAYVLGTQKSTPTNNTTNTTKINSNAIHNGTNHNNTTNTTPKVNITAQQAQQIAISFSAEMGFPAKAHGTPKLFKWTQSKLHTWVWCVPLEFESGDEKYGSVDVDAYTGNIIMNE